MRGHVICALLLIMLSGMLSAQTDSYAIQRALKKYTTAYGGDRSANALSSISIEGTQEQGGQVYDFLLRKKRPNMIRYRLNVEDVTIVAAYDGVTGWTQISRGLEVETRKLERDELQALKRESQFESPLFKHLENRHDSVEYVGRELVEAQHVYVFMVEASSGQRTRYYLAVQEPHVLKMERLADDGETVVMSTVYRNYREVSGYPFAFEIETRVGEEVVSLVKVDSINANPGLLSFYFKMPK